MIKATCRYVSLLEVSDLRATSEYQKMVHPLAYEFDLVRNGDYLILGVWTRLGTPWLYIASTSGDKQLQLVPAALFDFAWQKVPENWFIGFPRREEIEFLPVSLATIEGWFEKYVDDDTNVVKIVEEEIDGAR